jgi:hypothetical protein
MLLEELNFLTAFLENPNLCCGDELDQRKSNSYKKLDTLMYEIETTMQKCKMAGIFTLVFYLKIINIV